MSVSTAPLLGTRMLRALESLALARACQSNQRGPRQLARMPGASREFLGHRRFYAGDDWRRVDWRAYLRSEQLVVKLYQEEAQVPTRILLDCSRSMAAGTTGDETKLDYGKRLAAALLYIALARLESMTFQPFAAGLGAPSLYRRGRQHFAAAERCLQALAPEGVTGFAAMGQEFCCRYATPGVAIVISDFLCDADCLLPLKKLVDRGHELWLIQIWGPEDSSPGRHAPLQVVNVESGVRLSVSGTSSSVRRYEEAFAQYGESLRELACSHGGRYVGVRTDVSLAKTLFGSMTAARMIG